MISASYSKKRTKHCGQDMITQLATKVTCDINRLPIEHEGRTGEYWLSLVAVRTSLGSVRSATTDRGPLVSCLLYGTRLLIVNCTFGGLHLKGFCRDVFLMTRATQTKAGYYEFEKQIH